MDKKQIHQMLEEGPVMKEHKELVCVCGKVVKVGRYRINAAYKCNNCRHPKERK